MKKFSTRKRFRSCFNNRLLGIFYFLHKFNIRSKSKAQNYFFNLNKTYENNLQKVVIFILYTAT